MRARAGHENDDLRLVAVEEAGCHRGVACIGDSGWMVPGPLTSSGRAAAVRDTATTGAPASAKAIAIPRPRPRLAPTMMVVLPFKALIAPLLLTRSGWEPDGLEPLLRRRPRPPQQQEGNRDAHQCQDADREEG